MKSETETVRTLLKMLLKVIQMYESLLDLYVLDFFVDNHWDKLPASWRQSFEGMDPQDLGKILAGIPTNHILPLSFISLINCVKVLCLPRQYLLEQPVNTDWPGDTCATHPKLKNLFLKHVKLKKRHETFLMAEVVSQTALVCNCDAVIDFGSGLGHLARMLAYKHDLHVAGIECQSQLTMEARKLDQELEYTASKHLSPKAMSQLRRPIHINLTLTSQNQLNTLSLPNTMQTYGIIGLHPCGDLGPLLIQHFVKNTQVKFICVVGCCYMKLTDGSGYPMSGFMKSKGCKLSFVSREIACHALEVYCERLKEGRYADLKIHAYRAALERLLVELDPKLKHSPVRSIKHSDTMNFRSYCHSAMSRLRTPPPPADAWTRGEADVRQWRRVVTLYTLRLALAPLVETVVLLDRVLHILENDLSCEIRPVFDPKISPRNHIIVAKRL